MRTKGPTNIHKITVYIRGRHKLREPPLACVLKAPPQLLWGRHKLREPPRAKLLHVSLFSSILILVCTWFIKYEPSRNKKENRTKGREQGRVHTHKLR